jgi:hypothetical protein
MAGTSPAMTSREIVGAATVIGGRVFYAADFAAVTAARSASTFFENSQRK